MRKPSVCLHASKSPSRHYSWETHCHHRNQEWETEKQNNYKRSGRGMWREGGEMQMRRNARVQRRRRCKIIWCTFNLYVCPSVCERVCASVFIFTEREKEMKGIGGGSVAFRPVTYCRCESCLLGRMGLMGSLFLKPDCTLDERARSPWEGAASSDKLLEEPSSAGSPREPRCY